MARKRTSLDTLFARPPEGPPPAPPAAAAPPPPKGRRPAVKQQTVYLPLAAHEQLRRLAFENRTHMHDYLLEGLDRVFRERGLPGLDELRKQQP